MNSILASLFLSLTLSIHSFCQTAKNPDVNALVARVEKSIEKDNDRRYGSVQQAKKLGDKALVDRFDKISENSFISIYSMNNGWFDTVEFVVKACSEDDLKIKWLPKVLKIAKEFKFKEHGVNIVVINSGWTQPGSVSLIFDLTTYEFAFSIFGSKSTNVTKHKYFDINNTDLNSSALTVVGPKTVTTSIESCKKALIAIGKNKKLKVERKGVMEPFLGEDASLVDPPEIIEGFVPTGAVALVRQEVAMGAGSVFTSAELIICEGGRMRSLYEVGGESRFGGTLVHEGGQVIARTFIWTDNDPNCCPSFAEDRVLTYQGGQVVAGPAVRKRLTQ
jgi:hypothetical protein